MKFGLVLRFWVIADTMSTWQQLLSDLPQTCNFDGSTRSNWRAQADNWLNVNRWYVLGKMGVSLRDSDVDIPMVSLEHICNPRVIIGHYPIQRFGLTKRREQRFNIAAVFESMSTRAISMAWCTNSLHLWIMPDGHGFSPFLTLGWLLFRFVR
jgi:hypothetical protein